MQSASGSTKSSNPNLSEHGNHEGDAIEPQRRQKGIEVMRDDDGLIFTSDEKQYRNEKRSSPEFRSAVRMPAGIQCVRTRTGATNTRFSTNSV